MGKQIQIAGTERPIHDAIEDAAAVWVELNDDMNRAKTKATEAKAELLRLVEEMADGDYVSEKLEKRFTSIDKGTDLKTRTFKVENEEEEEEEEENAA